MFGLLESIGTNESLSERASVTPRWGGLPGRGGAPQVNVLLWFNVLQKGNQATTTFQNVMLIKWGVRVNWVKKWPTTFYPKMGKMNNPQHKRQPLLILINVTYSFALPFRPNGYFQSFFFFLGCGRKREKMQTPYEGWSEDQKTKRETPQSTNSWIKKKNPLSPWNRKFLLGCSQWISNMQLSNR